MPDFAPNWVYGTILVSRRARIMFLGWDKERQRMLGGGQPWFKAMKLGVELGTLPDDTIGRVDNYTPYGWKVEEPVTRTRKSLIAMPTEEFRRLYFGTFDDTPT